MSWNGGTTASVTLSGTGAAYLGNTWSISSTDTFNTATQKRFFRSGHPSDSAWSFTVSYASGVQTLNVNPTTPSSNPAFINGTSATTITYVEGQTIVFTGADGTTFLGEFVVPNSLTWTAANNNTNNSNNSGPFAEILLLPTNQQTPLYSHLWRVTHQTVAPGTQTYVLYKNGTTGISAATYIQVASAAGSTANSYLTPGNSIWTIRNQNGVGGDLVTYPPKTSKNKKVNCNFW